MENSNNKKKLCIMFGGKSTEYEVSLLSAYNVLCAADNEKYEITKIGVTKGGKFLLYTDDNEKIKNGEWINSDNCPVSLRLDAEKSCFTYTLNGAENEYRPDVIFPVMHGGNCEDGRLQGLFDICEFKYVGSGVCSSAVSMDKAQTKLILSYYNIPQADFIIAKKCEFDSGFDYVGAVQEKFSYPVFVKPANAGSSVGVSKARSDKELKRALYTAFKYDKKVLIEEFIKGKEVEVGIIGNEKTEASVCGEINPGADFYDYDTKYNNDTASYFIPARVDEKISALLRETAKTVYAALDCRGLSRVDFFACDDGKIIFNEINTLPGFTSISMYPTLFKHEGMTYAFLIDKLIELALKK